MLEGSGVLLSEELPGTVAAIVVAVRGLGLEGVIAKRKDSVYEPGERSDAWQKLKLENQQEFVIGGYRPGSNGIDALLVGYYDDAGLRFAGKVRAGFVPHLRREVSKALKPHHVDDCPFVDLPNPKSSRWGGGVTADEMREMQWVKPELVAQIRFVEWTAEGRLRHAAFLGLRSDKSAREVWREARRRAVPGELSGALQREFDRERSPRRCVNRLRAEGAYTPPINGEEAPQSGRGDLTAAARRLR